MAAPTDTAHEYLTLGQCARRLGVETWQVQSLIDRGLGPTPGRIGTYRVLREGDLPALADAMAAAGYRPAQPAQLQGVGSPSIRSGSK